MPDITLQVIEPVTQVEVTELVTSVEIDDSLPVVIETPIGQGPPGRDGVDGAEVSSKPDNRLTLEDDGLYVSDAFIPDPLAYYILAKG